MSQPILQHNELELYVQMLQPSKIDDLGTPGWFQAHQRVQKLSQQAIYEVLNAQEEETRNLLVSLGKVPVLVHEAICIQVWREKVLPHMLSTHSPHYFMPYLVMFHEATAISILETILYHEDCCEALGDCVIDLIDYCAFQMTMMVGYKEEKEPELKEKLSTKKEIEAHKKKLGFSMGIRCISLIRYLATNIESIPLSATTRLYATHDFPVLLATLRDDQPWIRKDDKGHAFVYEEDRWQPMHGSGFTKLSRVESQLWLALHQLLLSPKCFTHYDITEHRQAQLGKLLRYMHETVIDQLSPLLELKHWLSQLSISNTPTGSKRPVLLELMPEIRDKLLSRSEKKWKQLSRQQARVMFSSGNNPEQLVAMAKNLSETYDIDILESLQPTRKKCSGCGEETAQRCSRCKTFYYCDRRCQVKSWKEHKPYCDKIFAAMAEH